MISHFRYGIEPGRPRAIAKGWLVAVCAALAILSAAPLSAAPRDPAIDLSDTPMLARIKPPPPNIMFLLDDSFSMTYEILVQSANDGLFYPGGFRYLFEKAANGVPVDYNARMYWKTQWHLVNVIYYNPDVKYDPWPGYGSVTFPNANTSTPRIDPVNGSATFDLSQTSYTVVGVDFPSLNVPHSRYIVYDSRENKPYLVVLAGGSKKYYEVAYTVAVPGNAQSESITDLKEVSSLPAGLDSGRSYADELQNFANWFTYYRRREFVAKNAIATIIKSLTDFRVGIYGINQTSDPTLLPVNVTQGNTTTDNTNDLLEWLYGYRILNTSATPLKKGLYTIAEYFRRNEGVDPPYGGPTEGGACQQSFTVIITDGFYSDDVSPYKDMTLAGIAYDYYNTDLHPNHANKVPTNAYDTATHQHMSTYAVAFGAAGTLHPDLYEHDRLNKVIRDKASHAVVPLPTNIAIRSAQTVDDLWHAAVKGSGSFHSAGNPEELMNALNEIKNSIAALRDNASSSSVTVNGDYLYGKLGTDTFIYQALYKNYTNGVYEWTGDVKAFKLAETTGLLEAPRWSAAEQLETMAWDQRLIATFNGTTGIPFRFDSLTAPLKVALGPDPDKKVMYLRGGTVTGYRNRSQKLGDIVNSAPVFLDSVIYAGGNDGMLHAFNATTGREIFAYVPNLVFKNLELLSNPGYDHSFYVDLTPSVKKGKGIFAAGTTSTLLVGGLGKGGKGYFALDITGADTAITTEAILASRVKWEFPQPQASDPDMGYSFSKPVIVKSNSSAHPWVVIFGNGYNSASGKSALFIIDARTGILVKQIDAGEGPDNGLSTPIAVDPDFDEKVDFVYAGDLKGNLWKFNLRAASPDNWKVAFGTDTAPQPLFQAKGPGPGGTLYPQPITTRPDVMNHPEKHGFIVCFGTGKFIGDSDYSDGSVQSVYGIWDYGDPVYDPRRNAGWSPDDPTEFLGAFDRDSSRKLSNQPDTVSLLQQTQEVHTVAAGTFRILSNGRPIWLTENDGSQKPNPSDTAVNHAGYYFDLGTKERVISDVILRNKLLLAIGFTPDRDPCNTGGSSMFMEINAFTGGTSGGSLFDITGDLNVDAQDLVRVNFRGTDQDLAPSGMEFPGNIQPPAILRLPGSAYEKKYLSSSTGNIELLHEIGIKLGMAYWMEVHY
jgi:type IV pilus assembly protein PilY1